MTQSQTPAIVVTQGAGGIVVVLTPSASGSQTPPLGVVRAGDAQTVTLRP